MIPAWGPLKLIQPIILHVTRAVARGNKATLISGGPLKTNPAKNFNME